MFLSSLYFALLATCKPKIWQTTEMYSPQTFFSVTAAVVAPAVVICLNALLAYLQYRLSHRQPLDSAHYWMLLQLHSQPQPDNKGKKIVRKVSKPGLTDAT